MDEDKVVRILKEKFHFNENSIKKLKKFNEYLLDYNKKYNLISKSTENSIWTRHILDSAQIIKFIDPKKVNNIDDFGSGAGFPGLIISLSNLNDKFHVKLYEKSPVKRSFLISMMEKLKINNLDIYNNVYDRIISTDLIVC